MKNSKSKEIKAFRKLLNEFAGNHPLVNYTHRILCETYKNQHVKLGQPPNESYQPWSSAGIFEIGPCGNDGFVEINGCIKFPLWYKVETVCDTLDKLYSKKKEIK